MLTPCFRWHPDTRFFAGTEEVIPGESVPVAAIGATPVNDAITALHTALAANTGFCISDPALADLAPLPPLHFATLTGGTSGTPKVILRTQASWIASFDINARQFGYTATDSIAVLGGLSHSLALYGAMESLHLGLSVHALSTLKPSGQSAEMRRRRCTILYATPTQLRLLSKGKPLPDVRLILCGGGTLGAEVRRHINVVCPNAKLHIFYGAAETSFITMGDSATPEGSVGKGYMGVEIAVREPDSSGTGLVWVRSPYLFEHYLQGESPHTRRDGDWLTVGEYGAIDAEGHLYLRGRAGRVVNIADITVFPEELEAQLSTIKGVSICAVLARHDTLRGRHLIAVLPGPTDQALRKRLLAHCEDNRLTPLRDVLFLEPFPLLPSGKPDLRRIAALTGSTT